MIFSYLIKRLRRHISEMLLSVLIVTIIVILLLGLSHYYNNQQEKLDAVYDTFEIRCTVTNPTGARETDLELSPLYLDLLTSEEGILYPYATDVFLLRSLSYSSLRSTQETVTASGDIVSFYMTNDPEESAYLRDVQIQYLEGYDSDSFHTTDPICIISSDLSHKIAADGTVYLYTPGLPESPKNRALAASLTAAQRELKSWGVVFTDGGRKRLVTAEEARSLRSSGKSPGPGAVLTPLAREILSE